MAWKIPPLGFIGGSQQTLAQQTMQRQIMGNGGNGGGRKRRRKAKAKAAAPRRRRRAKAAAGKAARFVKGSAAARKYMAKLRRMRKK